MPPTPTHKPRRKRKTVEFEAGLIDGGTAVIDPTSGREKPAFPLAAFLWPAKGTVSSTTTLTLILLVAGLFRWSVGFWPYSGMANPPMHGDFEAQRHWMEVTVHLPVSHWYWHDLEWWGLDYPPLTAYHSWICGRIGRKINSSWFALYLSRGLDDQGLKVFMRATVILSEYLIYIPAAIIAVKQLAKLHGGSQVWERRVTLAAILMQPATMLIDHGHFQYNTVMLGFMLATVTAMLAGNYAWACIAFVGALGFKQMALFYAPAVGAYLLGSCLVPRVRPVRLLVITMVTALSFAILILPLGLGTAYDIMRGVNLPSDATTPPLLQALPFSFNEKASYYPYILQLAQMIHRVFPFARGLFEDKVANIWCTLHSSGIHKLTHYSPQLLQRAALGLTLLSILPPCTILLLSKQRKEILLEGLAACSWGFFLCAFQVHEKSVLLPLLPMTMMLAGKSGMKYSTRAWVGLANTLACWTMFPLLKRDELRIPYFILTLLWAWLMSLPPCSLELLRDNSDDSLGIWSTLFHAELYAAMIVWHWIEATVPPPPGKPDLWTVINVCIGCAGFSLCYLWCLWRCLDRSGLVDLSEKEVKDGKKVQ